ncbi:MAG: N-acetylmuramoyl-L-alanine amidase [Alphaproteobacteria bacterium]|nr:N-acetylmuramoyl-L-alanine amidase [Alphaproteobacteria bacterium]
MTKKRKSGESMLGHHFSCSACVCRKAAAGILALILVVPAILLESDLADFFPSAGFVRLKVQAQSLESLSTAPVATAVRSEEDGEQSRLIFSLSAPVEATAFVLADPDRVIVDLPQTDFRINPEIGKKLRRLHVKTGLIAAFRFGQFAFGKSRIVIDLRGPAKVERATSEKSENGSQAQLIIELTKTGRAEFLAAAQAARAQISAQAEVRTDPEPRPISAKPVVVLDPGHGGIDRGATVKGLVEKDLVFDFAKAVAAKLEGDGRFKVLMTRDDDSFVSLSERVRMARDSNAALFVSIHADTLSDAIEVSGATVYTVSERASDREAARLASKENQADAAAGLDKSENQSDVSDILSDLTRKETRAYSHFFAHTLANYWRVAGKLNKNPQRAAGFQVLKAPDVPSVLLELGYLSNSQDGLALTSSQWREETSRQVAAAIEAYVLAKENTTAGIKTDPAEGPAEQQPGEK